jgi:hypothetical protein
MSLAPFSRCGQFHRFTDLTVSVAGRLRLEVPRERDRWTDASPREQVKCKRLTKCRLSASLGGSDLGNYLRRRGKVK